MYISTSVLCRRTLCPDRHYLIVDVLTADRQIRHSIVASIPACHAGDQGSIPCDGEEYLFLVSMSKTTVIYNYFELFRDRVW